MNQTPNDPAIKGHIFAERLRDSLLIAFWAPSQHGREYHIAAADRYFSELAQVLGYSITKIEPVEVAAA